MKREPIQSVIIGSAGYAPDSELLELEFVPTGAVYAYFHVPESIFRAFMGARSKGAFFNKRIRDHFQFQKLTE